MDLLLRQVPRFPLNRFSQASNCRARRNRQHGLHPTTSVFYREHFNLLIWQSWSLGQDAFSRFSCITEIRASFLVMSEWCKTVRAWTGQYLGLPPCLGTYSLHRIKIQDRAEQDKRPHLKMENLGSRPDFATG